MSSFARFHETMADFMSGRIGAERVEEILGPSPSGTRRLALYPVLVRRQWNGVFDHFYRVLAQEVERSHPGRFARLRDDYLAARPPRHWEPNRNVLGLPSHLETQPDVPTLWLELADFTVCRFEAMHADRADVPRMDQDLFVRHYEHDVVGMTLRADRGETSSDPATNAAPRTVVFARHVRTGRFVVTTPSFAALVGLGRLAGEQVPDLPRGLTEQQVEQELRALAELGLIALPGVPS